MNGGKHPIRDGDFLLLELLTSNNAGSISGQTVAIERHHQGSEPMSVIFTLPNKI